MRSDMAEVIIERPRKLGHDAIRRQHKKTGLRIRNYDPDNEYDDLPTRLSSSRHKQYGRAAKYMDDLYGPIHRYFRSNVGRPWDQVWSEICEHLDRRNLAKNHLFEHFGCYVETDSFLGEDGEVYVYLYGNRVIKATEINRRDTFYVHPTTKLLCWSDDRPHKQAERAAKKAKEKAKKSWYVRISEGRYYVKFNGIWYIAEMEHFYSDYRWYKDESGDWCERELTPEEKNTLIIDDEYGYRWRVLSKRQCGKKELKAAGLKNDRPK